VAPITRILCPVDFSEASQHAIGHAIVIARWYKASITALHVYNPPFMPVPGLPPVQSRVPESELKRIHADTTRCFQSATASGVDVDVVVDVGQPAAQILARSDAAHCDLIVMGTHGAGGFEHLLLGSVTEKVLRRSECPVLTVPPRAQATSTLPFKRLLCAVDFSDSSLQGLELACSFASESNGTLTLLHVVEWPWHEPPPPVLEDLRSDQAAALAEFRRYVQESAVERLRALTPEARCVTDPQVAHGKPYIEILRVAAAVRADLIVIGVHGRNAADVMLFGSTTNQIVRRATCPVLTLRIRMAHT
jgi:nucleotide-binding universal stress UspA family protein